MPVSLLPETFADGGGLWSGKDVRFEKCHFDSEWNAGGKKTMPAAAFVADLFIMDEEITEENGWGVGKEGKASSDGKKESKTGDFLIGPPLVKSSNTALLINSIIDAIPADNKEEYIPRLFGSNKASDLNGLVCHMVRIKPDRPGIEQKTAADGKKYDIMVLVVDIILGWPWDKKAPKGAAKATPAAAKGKAAAKAAAPAAAVDDTAVDQRALMEISKVLGDEPVDRTEACQKVFGNIPAKEAKLRNAVLDKLYNPEWLTANAEEGGFVFDADGDTLAIAG